MAFAEGIGRIRSLGAYVMAGAVGGAALWLVWLWLRGGMGLMELFVLTVPFLLIGGGLRLLAWVLEGFLKPSVEHK